MVQIYFNKEQFPDTLEKCFANDDIVKLNHDIMYIPESFNEVMILTEEDHEDWQNIYDNWGVFIAYLIDTIQENLTQEEIWKEDTCIELLEKEFHISSSYPDKRVTNKSTVYICRTSEEIRVVLEFTQKKGDKRVLLHIPKGKKTEEEYDVCFNVAMESAQGISDEHSIKLEIDDVLGWQRENIDNGAANNNNNK